MRKTVLALVTFAAVVLLAPASASARGDVTITISGVPTQSPSLSPRVATITSGQVVTFDNKTTQGYVVCTSDDYPLTDYLTAGSSGDTSPIANGPINYYIAESDCTAGATHAANGTINVNPAPTTTTTETTAPAVTSTTAKSTTTTSKSTTTTSSTTSSSTTSSTTSTTSTMAPPVTVKASSGGGGGSSAPWLALAAIVVAGLAAGAYALYRRGQAPPPYGNPPGWTEPGEPSGWADEPPPTQPGPRI